jgi:Na+-driven multidrug efflux pump
MGMGNVLNAGLAWVAIFVLRWGVWGAALATTLALCLNFAALIAFVQSPGSILRIHRRHFESNPAIAGAILKMGAPIFLMQVLGTLTFLAANHGASALGGVRGVAMVGVFNSVSILLIYPALGVAQAMQPLIAYNRGAGRIDRVRAILRMALVATTAMGTVFATIVFFVPGPVAALFSRTDTELVALVREGLPWFMVSVAVFGISGTASHFFLAIQQPGKAGALLMGRQILAIPLFLALPAIAGYKGLYMVPVCSDVPFALIAAWMLRREWQILGGSSTKEPVAVPEVLEAEPA